MNQNQRIYLCIDLKSFYASVECVERGLDPMTASLVVADEQRTDKTICLAVSPALKARGVPGRCRVFEIPKGLNYIAAPPRMQLYIDYSATIYEIYLTYISKEDIHVYSIDEAFLDVTSYLSLYRMDAAQLGQKIISDILSSTGIPAVCGIGTNLYLAKIALDLIAKHAGDSIGYLDEALYRQSLWDHTPLTDFWRIGAQTAAKLNRLGIRTMQDVAACEEELLYRLLGRDAELLIDHAWGREPVTIADIKAYRPKSASLSSSQVLARNYTFEEGLLILKEMTDSMCLSMADQGVVTDSVTLTVGYSPEPGHKHASGTVSLHRSTCSYPDILPRLTDLYRRIVDKSRMIRRMNITCNRITRKAFEQYSLFTDYTADEKEKKLQKAALEIKKRYGKNALVRGMDLLEAGTALERNRQIGGHKSGE